MLEIRAQSGMKRPSLHAAESSPRLALENQYRPIVNSSKGPVASTDLTALDLGVLGALYDLSLLPSSNHARTVEALDRIAETGLCGSEDAEQVIRRLASDWLLPMPLVDVHGNNGTMYGPPTQPMYTEARLTPAGQLAVESSRGEIAPLPVGLINGDVHLVLGVGFGRWRRSDRYVSAPDSNPGGSSRVWSG